MIFDFADAHYNNVVVKITSDCNLRCRYCYVSDQRTSPPGSRMSFEVMRAIVDKYTRYAEQLDAPYRFVYFIWHGGEPLICGLDYFKEIVAIQGEFADRNCRVHNGVQTNGSLLDASWAAFLKRNDFSVGLSLDGPRLVQLSQRPGQGLDSASAIEAAMDLLDRWGLPYSVTAVVTEEVVPHWRELYEFFAGLHVRYVDFLPCYSGPKGDHLSPAGFTAFFLPLLDHWLADRTSGLEIRLFSDFLAKVKDEGDGKVLGCDVMGQCGEIQYVTENGELYPCTVLPITEDLRMGQLANQPFDACLSSQNYLSFQGRFNRAAPCEKCSELAVCRGGCAARRLYPPAAETRSGNDYYCQGRKGIIRRLRQHAEELCHRT